jgi:hypothetical protein
MALRVRLARNIAISLNDNITAFGYSILITGCYALMSALGHSPGVIEIFAAAGGAVLAFLVFELIMLTVFRDLRGIEPERNRFIAGLMRVISVPGGMGGTMLCAHYLTGPGAWLAGGFIGSFLFLVLDGIELLFIDETPSK